jgi:hypothetical protein
MSHIVKTLKNNITLPDGIFYPLANSTAILTDEEFSEIAAADFTNGIVQDLGSPGGGSGAGALGLVAMTMDPQMAPSTPSLVTGRLYCVRTRIDQALAATKMCIDTISTVGVTFTAAQLGVYDTSGNLLASTADFTATANAAATSGAILNIPLQATLAALPQNTMVYLAVLLAWSAGTPTFVGGRNFGANQTMTALQRLVWGASVISALPATLPTMTATSSQSMIFIGLGP